MLVAPVKVERRAAVRIPVNCPMVYRLRDIPTRFSATCLDLSVEGICFETDKPLAVGTELEVRIEPGLTISPPLNARFRVLRCNKLDNVEEKSPRGFRIAGCIEEILV